MGEHVGECGTTPVTDPGNPAARGRRVRADATTRFPVTRAWYRATMGRFLVQLAVAAVVMGVADGLWLGVVARRFYRDQMGSLMRQRPDVVAAAAFYVLYIVAAVLLVVRPGEALGWTSWEIAGMGALLGAAAYGTYDLTNRAVVAGFPWTVAIVDLAWGAALTAAVTGVTAAVV